MSLSISATGQTVYLTHATDEYVCEMENRIDPGHIQPWLARAFPGPRMLSVTAPTGFDPMPRLKLNRLFWPWGASRFSYAHFLTDQKEAIQLRNLAFGNDGLSMNKVTLRMDSPGLRSAAESISTQMWMMPPQPLTRPPDGKGGFLNGAYLVSLVDDRYYWQNIACPALAIDGSTTTWASLFPLFAAALGGYSITVDTIPAAYRLPSVGLNLQNELLPAVIDACAANIGMRLIRGLDGTVRVISATTAQSIRQVDDAAYPMRNLTGGGRFFNDLL